MTEQTDLVLTNEARRLSSGAVVKRYNIIRTNLWIYSAWEPLSRSLDGRYTHSTHTTIELDGESGRYGAITTRALLPELDRLPAYSEERLVAVTAFFDAKCAAAYAAILAAFPEARLGWRRDGDMELLANQPHFHDHVLVPQSPEDCAQCAVGDGGEGRP